MKLIHHAFIIAALSTMSTHAVETELESVQKPMQAYETYSNVVRGISVSVTKRPEDVGNGISWGRGTQEIIDDNGRKICVSIKENNEHTVRIRVPLDFDTIKFLLLAKEEPDCVRVIAASNITLAPIKKDKQLELLKLGISLKEALLRYYIWDCIRTFRPQTEVSGMLHLALRDPCIDIAHDSLVAIIAEYGLRAMDGSALKVTGDWRGLTSDLYVVCHHEILEVAKSLRIKRPDLISDHDLTLIRNRSMPPDQWFEIHLPSKDPASREYFRKYAAKTEAEQSGAGQPASKPADKPPVKDQPSTPTSKNGPR